MDQALRRELGSLFDSQEVSIAVELAKQAIAATSGTGRTLYSGWNSLPWPDEPHLALWQACTVLREHRSGSHLLALATEELDGPQSVITQVAVNEAPVDWIQHEAGYSKFLLRPVEAPADWSGELEQLAAEVLARQS